MKETALGEIVALGASELGDAYLARPAAGSGPGVIVCHSWWGRTPFFTELCDALAGEGFVALSPDLYDGILASTIPDAQTLAGALPSDVPLLRLPAAVEFLVNHVNGATAHVAALGCSMGGAHAIQLASWAPEHVRAVVTFCGTSDIDLTGARAAFQGHFVDDDEYEPDELVDGMRAAIEAAGREVEIHRYPGARHWFFEPTLPEEHDPAAAALAFQRTVDFLNRQLRPTEP